MNKRTLARSAAAALSLALTIGLGAVTAPAWSTVIVPLEDPAPAAAPAATSEQAAAEYAKRTGMDALVDGKTTPTEETVAHPDGTFTRSINTEPVRMIHEGQWEAISTILTREPTETGAVYRPSLVPADIALGVGGDAHLATIKDDAGHEVKESWPFGALPAPEIKDNTATYAGVLPGVDLIQVVRKASVSQVLRINSPQAASDPRLAQMRIWLDTKNVQVSEDGQGGLTAKGQSSGQEELRTGQGRWWDSSQPNASATDPGGHGMTSPFKLSLAAPDGKTNEVFDMASVLDADNKSVYPIYVDPDWSVLRTNYIYVDSAYPTSSYLNDVTYTDQTSHVGFLPYYWVTDGRNHVTRSLWDFNTTPMIGKSIFAARFYATEVYSSSCQPTPVSLYLSEPISSATTWNNQPRYYMKLDTQTVAKGWSASCPAETIGWDMGPAKDWISGSSTWTVALNADNEADPLGWKRFDKNAMITINYAEKPQNPVVTGLTGCAFKCPNTADATGSPAYPAVTREQAPQFSIVSSDGDGAVGGAIYVWGTLYNADNQAVRSTVNGIAIPGTGGTALWRPDPLPDGKYTLQTQVSDQYQLTSAIVSMTFIIATDHPGPPAITVDQKISTGTDPTGVPGSTTYNITINKTGTKPVYGFVYTVRAGGPAPTYPASLACNTRVEDFVVVCATESLQTTIGAIAETTTITAWAFDIAGNVNLQTQYHSSPASSSFRVGGAAWTPQLVPVTPAGSASWVQVTDPFTNPTSQDCRQPSASPAPAVDAMQFNGPGAVFKTASAVIDVSNSFTVGGWFCAASPAGASWQTALTQLDNNGVPGGLLRLDSAGRWQFGARAVNGNSIQAVSPLNPSRGNGWYFLLASYDKVNQQVRISASRTEGTATWVYATAEGTHTASTGAQPLILGGSSAAGAEPFTGQIVRPIATQRVLDSAEPYIDAWSKITGSQQGVLK
ncbi:LamG-like jellyroll fold domain-containing protein [Arthrobacter sp. M4]|uniref:LamG-like jellyroll fold domain-containing protein n=1 Tax=Arthrobacter sp. M4 TaxID=218160 RepID=UPI001CDCECA2|nr:LamG-like jellyroll fold domain-containing protein [Arthrobacter sp. M4]MCA4133322.1 hypothetical protein [Arthrobacter sp. M4]